MTRYFTVDIAVRVFRTQIGDHPIIGDGLAKLDGAVKAPSTSWDGTDLHPTVFGKSAVLLREVAVAHAFEDGNKRLAWLLTTYFLYLNGYHLNAIEPTEVDAVVRSVCEREGISLEGVSAWLERHCSPHPF